MSKFFALIILLGCGSFSQALPEKFGLRNIRPRLDGRIVGGVPTTIEQFPHQVSLRFYGSHRCGGSIFKSNVIICAAHCTADIGPSNFQINVGSTFVSTGGQRYQVARTIEHADFDDWEYDNDIALIILEKEIELSKVAQPIALASAGEELRPGTMVLISGWGTLQSGGSAPNDLQVVKTAVVSHEQCVKAYQNINPVTSAMLCAGEPEGGKDSCQGDSGGPLIAGGKLYGIVSWGYGCAFPGYYGVYTKVAFMRQWIDDQIKTIQ